VLVELRVENLLLLERAELRLGPGLTAITGETGAGKTVLAHALDLLLGGRPRPGIVRPGAQEAYVEGVFELPEGLLDDPSLTDVRDRLPAGADELVLGRRVSASGRSRAFVQGRSANGADLRELGTRLVAFYGQHEHRRLTLASAQLEVLDSFCGPGHLAERAAYSACHARVRDLRRTLEELEARACARERDLDLLIFEIDEIDALRPSEDEHTELLAERERLRHVEDLRAAAAGALEAVAAEAAEAPERPAAGTLLAEAEELARCVAGVDPALDSLAERLGALRIEADDLAAELRRYALELEGDPGRLEQVEERLAVYDRLMRKHGGSVAAVLYHHERCRSERERLEGLEVELGRAQNELQRATAAEAERAAGLSAARAEAAPRLARRVEAELSELALANASFSVELEQREELSPAGAERVELMLAPNPGVPPAPLRDTASGGELSRVMLALMTVSSSGAAATLVFDEVDAGIGGQTARAVGERLRALAVERQVVCITHLPQIASLANRHFRIEKHVAAGVARAVVEPLGEGAVVEELCRMLGADAGDAGARRHAQELLAAA
jgi:DNA repair protein RecN (Recombination protein N)